MYSFADTARILRVSPARLRYWQQTKLVCASTCSEDGEPLFEWQDLVELRSLVRLVDRGIPLQRIRRCLDRYRRRHALGEASLGCLRLTGLDDASLVCQHEGALEASDGQLLFDFTQTGMQPAVASLEEARIGAERHSGESALHWFEHGCDLDTDPASEEEACAAYRRAIELDPEFADAYCNLGTLHFNRGRREAARSAYEAALGIQPDHLEANYNLANLLEEWGCREEARVHYEAAVASDPLFPEARLNLALLYEKLERRREAREQWRYYLQQVTDGHWADIARQRLGESPWPVLG